MSRRAARADGHIAVRHRLEGRVRVHRRVGAWGHRLSSIGASRAARLILGGSFLASTSGSPGAGLSVARSPAVLRRRRGLAGRAARADGHIAVRHSLERGIRVHRCAGAGRYRLGGPRAGVAGGRIVGGLGESYAARGSYEDRSNEIKLVHDV